MNWLMESPLAIVGVGLILIVGLCAGWVRTGKGSLLAAAVGAVLLTLVLLGVERYVKTDREQVAELLRETATSLQNNDQAAVLRSIHSAAAVPRLQVESAMALWELEEVDIKQNLKVEPQPDHQPPRVMATFNVSVQGHLKNGGFNERGLMFVTVELRKEDGQWRIYEATPDDPRAEMFGRSSND